MITAARCAVVMPLMDERGILWKDSSDLLLLFPDKLVYSPPATQSQSCDVAGGHDYVYENISCCARCELFRPQKPFESQQIF